MALKNKGNNITFLVVLGGILIGYGFGAAFVEQNISRLAAVYIILGAASLIICIIRIRSLWPKALPSSSHWKKHALLFFLLMLWTIFFVLINLLAYRGDWRLDMTKAKQHTLTDDTQKFIKNLYQEIQLTAFYTGLPPKYLEDLFGEYERVSNGRITTEIIDPIVQIGYASQFGHTINSNEHKVFVQSGNETRELDFTGGVLTEEQLTNAIVRVIREVRRVYFLTGHNEYNIGEEDDQGLKTFETLLATNHVISKRLMLDLRGEIPDDCDVLVIAGPKSHLTPKEEEIISQYLERGGDALFLIEHTVVTTPDKPLTEEQKALNPSLNGILTDWGIRVADDVVVDLASHASGDVGSPATRNYMARRSIVNDLDYTFFVRPRSIAMHNKRRPTVKLAPIILTASEKNSWGETNRMLDVKFNAGIDRAGPVPIAFALREGANEEEGDDSDTRIIVITDADFLTNAYIDRYSNAKLGINAINWLSEVDYQVLFGKKDIEVERLDLTSRQKRVVGVILFAMPMIIAGIGIMVWVRRRIL